MYNRRDRDPPVQLALDISKDTSDHDDSPPPLGSIMTDISVPFPVLHQQELCHLSGNYCVAIEATVSVAANVSKMLVMAYYPDWIGDSFPPSKIDFSRFDWIDFAFAVPTADGNLAWDDPVSGPVLLDQLVTSAHDQNSSVKLSIGGWTGSK